MSNHTDMAEKMTVTDWIVGMKSRQQGESCLAAARPPVFDLITREGLM